GGDVAQPITILAVGEWTSGDGAIVGGVAEGAGNYALARVNGEVGVSQDSPLDAEIALADATPAAMLAVFSGASSSLRIGPDWTASTSGGTQAGGLVGVTIGALANGSLLLTGRVPLVAAWDHALTADERAQVAAYV